MQELPCSGLSWLRDSGLLLSSMGPYSDVMVSFLVPQRITERHLKLDTEAHAPEDDAHESLQTQHTHIVTCDTTR